MDIWYARFQRTLWLGSIALISVLMLFPMILLADDGPEPALIFLAFLLAAPGVIYLNLVTIWHWKARYRGKHSDLWGALILIETSGWFKIVYLFRHIMPDARGTGRYVRTT